ncbi:MAG: CotH kinase family protein [Saprospiraceae bacterium]
MRTLYTILLVSFLGIRALVAQTAVAQDTLVVHFEPSGGFHAAPVRVQLYAPYATDIFYTLDGSPPGPKSQRYITPIFIDETAVLRTVAYRDGIKGHQAGQTYFIQEPSTRLPVVSMGISSDILFNPSYGIFVAGSGSSDSLWYKPGANFWSRKEHAVHLEMYNPNGEPMYNSLSGMRLFGGMSRLFPQKSMALIARITYGESRFRYPIFGEDQPDTYKFLVLRNSGSDFGKSHFRDGLMTTLVKDWDMETQAFQPAHVYINGNYWGIYNLREKVNRYFIAAHAQDVHRDSIELLEHFAVRKQGSRRHYQGMLDFLARYDLTSQANFEHLQTLMEVDNFLQYQIAQIYFDNQDAGGNIKYWRPAEEGARWRWILYDTDWGYGLHDAKAYRHNSLLFHTEANGPHWPNPPWSTFLLRKLLQNNSFRHQFINRFADYLNTDFSAERATQVVDSFYLMLHQEMPRHLKRWRLSEKEWNRQLDIMREFADKRPEYMRQFLADF